VECDLYASIISDFGNAEDVTLHLPPLSIWSADYSDGTWGDGGLWCGSGFTIRRAQFGCLGKKFDVEFYDNGNLEGGFQLGDWSLLGNVEDRR
jgi:hypothetical protein